MSWILTKYERYEDSKVTRVLFTNHDGLTVALYRYDADKTKMYVDERWHSGPMTCAHVADNPEELKVFQKVAEELDTSIRNHVTM